MYNEFCREVRVYDANGRKIVRRYALIAEDQQPCGVLINLKSIHACYSEGGDDISGVYDDGDTTPDTDNLNGPAVSVYPQAFLRSAGHIQVKGVMPAFKSIIKDVHRGFEGAYDSEIGEDENSDDP